MSKKHTSIDQKVITLKNHFGWNNVELADAAGVSKQAVGQWIKESRMPSQEAVLNLKQKYQVNDLWIYGKSEEMILSDAALSDDLESVLREIESNNPEQIPQILKLLRAFVDPI